MCCKMYCNQTVQQIGEAGLGKEVVIYLEHGFYCVSIAEIHELDFCNVRHDQWEVTLSLIVFVALPST